MSTKDYTTISYLIKVEKKIQKLYERALKLGSNVPPELTSEIVGLIDSEEMLLNSLELTHAKFKEIKKFLINKSGIRTDFKTLIGFDNHVTHLNYPFYRLYAKLKEKTEECDPLGLELIDTSYRDILVKILFKIFIREIKKHPNENSKTFREYAYLILMDSTSTELELLKNSLEEPTGLINHIPATLDTIIAFLTRKSSLSIEDTASKLSAVKESENNYLKMRFNEHYEEIIKALNNYLSQTSCDFKKDPIALSYIHYIEALIALMPIKDREAIYTSFLKYFSIKKDGEGKIFIYIRIANLENNIISDLSTMSFFRTISLK